MDGSKYPSRGRAKAVALLAVFAVLIAAIVIISLSISHGAKHSTRTAQRPAAHHRSTPSPAQTPVAATGPQNLGVPVSRSATAQASVPMPKSLVGWRRIFADDFQPNERTTAAGFSRCRWGATLTASTCSTLPAAAAKNWFTYPDGEGGPNAGGVFEPSRTLSIGPSGLSFSLQTLGGRRQLVGALPKVSVDRTGALTSALYAIRFHATSVRGWDFVFNLWPPSNDISRAGYIQLTGSLNGDIQALVYDPGHRQTEGTVYYPADPLDEDWDTGVPYAGWHTAVIERTAKRLEFFIDGRAVALDYNAVPHAPLRFALQTSPAATTPARGARGNVTVSWVQIYVPAATRRST